MLIDITVLAQQNIELDIKNLNMKQLASASVQGWFKDLNSRTLQILGIVHLVLHAA